MRVLKSITSRQHLAPRDHIELLGSIWLGIIWYITDDGIDGGEAD